MRLLALPLAAAAVCSCVPVMELDVTAWGEGYIEDGIPAEDMVDGWSVTFDRFLVSVREVHVRPSSAADAVSALDNAYVVDLVRASDGEGHLLATTSLPIDDDATLAYRIAYDADAKAAPSMSDVDVAALSSGECALLVEGAATRGDEEKTFSWCFPTDTTYSGCALATDDGFVAQLTIHADHLFYDDLDAEEPGVAFDLIASADADEDGEVTQAELEATDITGEDRYQVGGRDIDDLWGFLAAQTRTVGHINGEGHCDAAE